VVKKRRLVIMFNEGESFLFILVLVLVLVTLSWSVHIEHCIDIHILHHSIIALLNIQYSIFNIQYHHQTHI